MSALRRWFEPPPAVPAVSAPPLERNAHFKKWQREVLITTLAGYAVFYFVRKNIGIAMPGMEQDLGVGKAQLGLFLTLHGLIYGVSKFANGILGDRCGARAFIVAGLVASAAMNIAFGLSSAVVTLGVFWMANGWFQGMGFPPCARLLTHWIPPRELATRMSFWNTSHSVGASLVVVLCGYLVAYHWRLCFVVPAGLALLAAVGLWWRLPDTPRSVGLPELPDTPIPSDAERGGFRGFLKVAVFSNPYIWLIATANFFVYAVRYAVLDWGPTLLYEYHGVSLARAGWMVAAFEVSGVAGMLLAGWATDRWLGSRGARTCLGCMLLAVAALAGFWRVPEGSHAAATLLLMLAGFAIYGPQALVGIAAANLATRRAAASAIGFTGLFGYASTVVSGWGLGWLVQGHGWSMALMVLIGFALAGAAFFGLAWQAKATPEP